jgi:hypothetical protein
MEDVELNSKIFQYTFLGIMNCLLFCLLSLRKLLNVTLESPCHNVMIILVCTIFFKGLKKLADGFSCHLEIVLSVHNHIKEE